jgi:hypothetical protein
VLDLQHPKTQESTCLDKIKYPSKSEGDIFGWRAGLVKALVHRETAARQFNFLLAEHTLKGTAYSRRNYRECFNLFTLPLAAAPGPRC